VFPCRHYTSSSSKPSLCPQTNSESGRDAHATQLIYPRQTVHYAHATHQLINPKQTVHYAQATHQLIYPKQTVHYAHATHQFIYQGRQCTMHMQLSPYTQGRQCIQSIHGALMALHVQYKRPLHRNTVQTRFSISTCSLIRLDDLTHNKALFTSPGRSQHSTHTHTHTHTHTPYATRTRHIALRIQCICLLSTQSGFTAPLVQCMRCLGHQTVVTETAAL